MQVVFRQPLPPTIPKSEQLKISIGICAYNEAKNIGRLLTLLVEDLDISEIIVVASGCTDGTEVQVAAKTSSGKVKLIVEAARNGKSEALNKILSVYEGDILVLLSADVLPSGKCISSLVAPMLRDRRIGMVGGRPVPLNRGSGLAGYMAKMFWRLHHRTLSYLDQRKMNTQGGEIIALRRGIIERFPEDVVNDDAYAGVTTWKKGYLVKYCPDAIVYMKAPETLREIFTQRRRIVFGHHQVKMRASHYPRVLETMALYSPPTVVKVLADELTEGLQDFPKLLAAIVFELFVNAAALFDIAKRKNHRLWRVAHTTKDPSKVAP